MAALGAVAFELFSGSLLVGSFESVHMLQKSDVKSWDTAVSARAAAKLKRHELERKLVWSMVRGRPKRASHSEVDMIFREFSASSHSASSQG